MTFDEAAVVIDSDTPLASALGRSDSMTAADQRSQSKRPQVEAKLPRHDARYIEQVVDEIGLLPRVAFDDLERVGHPFACHPLRAQQIDPAEDDVQRRPQLVRQRREKLVLGAIGRVRFGFAFLERFGRSPQVGLVSGRRFPGANLRPCHQKQEKRQPETGQQRLTDDRGLDRAADLVRRHRDAPLPIRQLHQP